MRLIEDLLGEGRRGRLDRPHHPGHRPRGIGTVTETLEAMAFKSGAPARSERVAKYNRLLEIAATTPDLRYDMP